MPYADGSMTNTQNICMSSLLGIKFNLIFSYTRKINNYTLGVTHFLNQKYNTIIVFKLISHFRVPSKRLSLKPIIDEYSSCFLCIIVFLLFSQF